jgi:putative hydrolase of the HAD superfamily
MTPTLILFDLDNTLYPPDCGLLDRVDERINDYICRHLSLSPEETRALRRHYVETYGTTLQGLRVEHGIDVEEFLAYAHDPIAMEEHLSVDEDLLAALAAIEVEKVVFTNSPRRYARRVLEAMRLTGEFRQVCDLEFMEYDAKPSRNAFHRVLTHLGRRAEECVLVEDTLRNLAVAKELGMTTILVGEESKPPPYVDYVIARPAQVPHVLAELMKDRDGRP